MKKKSYEEIEFMTATEQALYFDTISTANRREKIATAALQGCPPAYTADEAAEVALQRADALIKRLDGD